MSSKVTFYIFSLFAEIERLLISERTRAGLEAAVLAGKKLGAPRGIRKSKLDEYRPEIERYLSHKVSIRSLASMYDVSHSTMKYYINTRGLKMPSKRKRKAKKEKMTVAKMNAK